MRRPKITPKLPPRLSARRLPRVPAMVAGPIALAVVVGGVMVAARAPSPKAVPDGAPSARSVARAPIVRTIMPAGTQHDIDYGRIDATLSAMVERRDMVGLGIAIIERGKLSFVKGYGVTQGGGHEPVTPGTVFRWASVSKGVAATLIGKLAGQGKLSLDDPVSKFRTSLRVPGGIQNLTVAELLSHRTGIVKNAYDDRLEDGEDPKVTRAMLGKLPPYCKPGTCFGYQNIAYDAASEIVERVTGRSYAQAVKRELFAPLGMTSASVTRTGLTGAASWARPHHGRSVRVVEEAYYRVPAAGGVNSSIFDLGLWMRAQMGEAPQVIPKAVLGEIHQPRVKTPRRGRADYDVAMTDGAYGLGWRDQYYAGHRLIGHRGAVDGYRSLILFDPATKTGVAMLWNSLSNRPTGLPLEVFDMAYHRPAKRWVRED